ncbi:surface antigen [Plasmodium falciparum UGT5.1]|uniref:Surface antigen n=1 Tax=Plasmodium falciparum UGT5.1 TaxID=1237627 RepID=W7JCH8_PLAFA|nr:surface antigen [Plasmodium falciparum UGT5.1]
MKAVMQDFDRQTSQRFEEYNERIIKNRQKCKEECEKDIQKIILKDKLEKELMDKFATLQTDIQNDAIPTCVCEKSLADKVEKTCLKCTQNLGGIVAPSLGVLGGIAEGALSVWKPVAIKAAIAAAEKAGAAEGAVAGNAKGMEIVIHFLKDWGVDKFCSEIYGTFISTNRYAEVTKFVNAIITKRTQKCTLLAANSGNEVMCSQFDISFGINDAAGNPLARPPVDNFISKKINQLAVQVKKTADYVTETTTEKVTAELTTKQTTAINATYASYEITIIASIIAIIVIVLIMVIIYLILRYRRKKKMKKKLQYIKLLEE